MIEHDYTRKHNEVVRCLRSYIESPYVQEPQMSNDYRSVASDSNTTGIALSDMIYLNREQLWVMPQTKQWVIFHQFTW